MTPNDTAVDGLKQAFEDFVAHEAERAIAEATQDQASHKRLYVVLYGDGRYATEHFAEAETPDPVPEEGGVPRLIFPVEPLRPDEQNGSDVEGSDFGRPIETLWASYEQALKARFGR